MRQVSVSILVAVYNAEHYLAQCLDSLLSQTLSDIQVICIDDGSTDGSLQLLQQYAAQDSRVEVYRMAQNSGQAKARNEGLRHVRGRYVAYLDSDDWMSSEALQRCVETFEQHPQTDCVILRVLFTDGAGAARDYDNPIPLLMTGKEAFEASLDWSIHGVYVARSELYLRWPFDDTCRTYSDDNTTRLHYYHSREVRYQAAACYYYRDHSASATRRPSVRRFDYLRAAASMKRQLLDIGVGESILRRYETQRWRILVGCYMFYHVHGSQLPAADRRYGLSELEHAWRDIDRSLLDTQLVSKFGYRPCSNWTLFRLQEWLYFTLRGFLGRNE